ncbi:hypothetical protein TKK_0015221 [Trichogramma kaykai]|uniref:RNA helicase n=1 Tax=Trichogramma kaykai TaxID=54128 RepID=A0ABD2WAS1_9HYME
MSHYGLLVGLRSNMCNCVHGIRIKQKLVKQANILAQTYKELSTSSLISNFGSASSQNYFLYTDIRRFNTCLSVKYLASSNRNKNHQDLIREREDPIDKLDNRLVEEKNFFSKHGAKIESVDSELTMRWINTSSLQSDRVPSKEIEARFPEPKIYLHNYYTLVSNETKIPNVLRSSSKKVNTKKSVAWSVTYDIKWPETRSFTATGTSKSAASRIAALKLLHWLHITDRIRNQAPVIYNNDEKRSILTKPEELSLNKDSVVHMQNFLEKYEEKIKAALEKDPEDKLIQSYEMDNQSTSHHPISHYEVDIEERNAELLEALNQRENVKKPNLPIFAYKEAILKELEENQAVVIKGDTGCGKTTQVPQFIMDYFAAKGKGGECNMIVTQPRRISAISLAQRIAYERQEKIGDVVGYQVRLLNALPKQNGAILFCTTGVLLKKLQSNLGLKGCSHIIVDEAHERSVDTDLLLVLLRRAMKENPELKVVIMSATINANLFQDFLGCKSIEVPGRLFPVKMHFIEDMVKLGISRPRVIEDEDGNKVFVDAEAITDMIKYITDNKPPGAILVFLPGWTQIQKIQNNLENFTNADLRVIPLHSKINMKNQSTIFEKPPEGVRKIILATDIAETGITVPDVVYVIDSACHNQSRWYESKGLSAVDTHFVSQANIKQRKGRAGRVTEGESYHFITRDQYECLELYPKPEVLRVSLEKVVLDSKTYSHEKAVNFLGEMPQPPRLSAVNKAVMDLQQLGALDYNENLTALGKRIAMFTIHPKMSKAMVYSTIFQCLNPVATVASAFTMDSDVFYNSLNSKARNRFTKQKFHPTSDHLSIAWIYAQWESFLNRNENSTFYFCKKNNLHAERVIVLHKTRSMNIDNLRDAGLVDNVYRATDLNSRENDFATLDELVRGVLLAGMDHILKHRNFDVKKGRLSRSGTSLVTEDNVKAQLTPESVNYKAENYPSPFLTYYRKTHHMERRTILIRESSMISPVTVVLFSQGRVTGSLYPGDNGSEDKLLIQIEKKKNVQLLTDVESAKTLLRFRDLMWSVVRYFVENDDKRSKHRVIESGSNAENIHAYKKELLKVLAHVLSNHSTMIDNPPEKKQIDSKPQVQSLLSDDDGYMR